MFIRGTRSINKDLIVDSLVRRFCTISRCDLKGVSNVKGWDVLFDHSAKAGSSGVAEFVGNERSAVEEIQSLKKSNRLSSGSGTEI